MLPAASRSRTLERVELFDPPGESALAGVTFLEFAVDEASEWRLDNVRETLGFLASAAIAPSRSRSTARASIHLILNAEPESFARRHFAEHGPSICAIGLAAEDSVRALNRATALHCPRYDSRVGPHELKHPRRARARRQPGVLRAPAELGSGAMYEIDFDLTAPGAAQRRRRRPDADRPRRDGPSGRVARHLDPVLPRGAGHGARREPRAVRSLRPRAELRRRQRGGYGADGAQRVAEPRARRWPGRSPRRAAPAFITSRSPRTTSSRRWPGAGQRAHSSSRSRETITTISPLASTSRRILVAAHARGHILYERTDGGEYFHAYSESFAGRFFFEVVQRVGRLDGYGAMNAPVRIASQVQRPATH